MLPQVSTGTSSDHIRDRLHSHVGEQRRNVLALGTARTALNLNTAQDTDQPLRTRCLQQQIRRTPITAQMSDQNR